MSDNSLFMLDPISQRKKLIREIQAINKEAPVKTSKKGN